MKLNILHEDEHLIVCVKPYGVPSQSDRTNSEDMIGILKLIYMREKTGQRSHIWLPYTDWTDRSGVLWYLPRIRRPQQSFQDRAKAEKW